MAVFIGTLLVLCVIAVIITKKAKTSASVIKNSYFEKLQNQYLNVYYLATFSDWLQGPYFYKLYSDYGYDDDMIAILCIAGFVSSSLFGMLVGYAADKYGRKFLCSSFGILYTLCCFTKVSSKFHILFIGRVLGGIATSILFSAFEAWYVNEHLNYYKLPPEWLNVTFGKAAFYTGLLAIIAGIIAQFLAETLHLGSVFPFLLAIPILILSTYLIITTWDEHPPEELKEDESVIILSALHLIFCKEKILLALCFIQSLYESVMYIFIFSWTPILSAIDPPLGLVFSTFMVAFMIGTKIYSLFISKRYHPQNLLTLTCAIGLISYTTITIIISSIHMRKNENSVFLDSKTPIYFCFFSFILYEMSVGLYFPAIGYLRGRVIPEKYRASVTNWFRVPMNIFTCFGLIFNQKHKNPSMSTEVPQHILDNCKFPILFFSCSVFLVMTMFINFWFSQLYVSSISKSSNGSNQEDINSDVNGIIQEQDISANLLRDV